MGSHDRYGKDRFDEHQAISSARRRPIGDHPHHRLYKGPADRLLRPVPASGEAIDERGEVSALRKPEKVVRVARLPERLAGEIDRDPCGMQVAR